MNLERETVPIVPHSLTPHRCEVLLRARSAVQLRPQPVRAMRTFVWGQTTGFSSRMGSLMTVAASDFVTAATASASGPALASNSAPLHARHSTLVATSNCGPRSSACSSARDLGAEASAAPSDSPVASESAVQVQVKRPRPVNTEKAGLLAAASRIAVHAAERTKEADAVPTFLVPSLERLVHVHHDRVAGERKMLLAVSAPAAAVEARQAHHQPTVPCP